MPMQALQLLCLTLTPTPTPPPPPPPTPTPTPTPTPNPNPNPNQALQLLCLDDTRCGDVAMLMACAVGAPLSRLHMARCAGVTDKGLNVLGKRSGVTELNLAGCEHVSDETCNPAHQGLATPRTRRLQRTRTRRLQPHVSRPRPHVLEAVTHTRPGCDPEYPGRDPVATQCV
jgi:hypothetical protein